MMRPHFGKRLRGASLSTVPPAPTSADFDGSVAHVASRILYKSPLPSQDDLPIYILNAAAFPDTKDVNYDKLLGYVLARLPNEEELIGGKGYEIIFFAAGDDRGSHEPKKGRPSISWLVQAYNVLSRAMRKRLQKLYLVHERKWVRVVTEMFSTMVSPKFRRKIVHASTLSALALHIPIEDLLIPPSAYYHDRKLSPHIYAPYATGRRAFGATKPLPISSDGSVRLPRVLRETTSFLLAPENIKTEGLFRVNARAITLDVLKEAYDRGQKFLVWREGKFVMCFHQWKDGFGDVTVEEGDHDGYPVFAAAGLIKLWYSDLKEPIFPQSSYQYLERTFAEADLDQDQIMDLIGESSEWSHINKMNRQAITMHLLPTLAAICKHPENKMTPKSLAVCFAPSLLCGSDPVQDAKMCSIVARILEYAIAQWDQGLKERCKMSDSKFKELLTLPKVPNDREEPLDTDGRPTSSDSARQTQGILLVDHLSSSDDDAENEERPPLPPRSLNNSTFTTSGDKGHPIHQALHRKPLKTTSESAKPDDLPIDRISLDSGKALSLDTGVETTAASTTPMITDRITTSPVVRKPLPLIGSKLE
jgi:Rho GTPase-activating protein 1